MSEEWVRVVKFLALRNGPVHKIYQASVKQLFSLSLHLKVVFK